MMKMEISTEAVVQRIALVAARSMRYRYYHWDWGEAVGIEGLFLAQRVVADPGIAAFVSRMIDGWILHSPDPWYPDHVAPGRVLVELWRESGDPRLLEYARRLGEFLIGLPRTSSGAYLHRCDLPDFASVLAVDCIQTDAPFFCSLAQATGEPGWFDAAADHILGHVNALQDEQTGLLGHAHDDSGNRTSRIAWGRGNGWALLGLADTLSLLPQSHPAYERILQRFRRLAHSLGKLQDKETGLWHTVLDEPETYLEISASLMFIGALMLAVQSKILPDSYAAVVEAGWRACWNRVDSEGGVEGVSARTPPRRDVAPYNAIKTGGVYPWGQGPYLITATRYLQFQAGHCITAK
jgi:unsaturated rhamnogalacturonyl hydrolase